MTAVAAKNEAKPQLPMATTPEPMNAPPATMEPTPRDTMESAMAAMIPRMPLPLPLAMTGLTTTKSPAFVTVPGAGDDAFTVTLISTPSTAYCSDRLSTVSPAGISTTRLPFHGSNGFFMITSVILFLSCIFVTPLNDPVPGRGTYPVHTDTDVFPDVDELSVPDVTAGMVHHTFRHTEADGQDAGNRKISFVAFLIIIFLIWQKMP